MKLYGEQPIFTSKIAFVSNRDGNDEIYMMDYDGANQTRITFNKIKDYMPGLVPRPAEDRLHVLQAEQSRPGHPVPLRGEEHDRRLARDATSPAAFSPDGKKLAFCSTMDGNAEIYTAEADGTNVRA